jgi:hypothetical protein
MDAAEVRALRPRRMVLPAMVGLLAAYMAAHSPLVRLVGRFLGRDVSRCYFTCSGWAPNGHPVDAASALVCVLLAGGAAWLVTSRISEGGAEEMLAFGLLAVAFIVVPASLLGSLGWAVGTKPLQPPLVPLLTGLPAALVVLPEPSGAGGAPSGCRPGPTRRADRGPRRHR